MISSEFLPSADRSRSQRVAAPPAARSSPLIGRSPLYRHPAATSCPCLGSGSDALHEKVGVSWRASPLWLVQVHDFRTAFEMERVSRLEREVAPTPREPPHPNPNPNPMRRQSHTSQPHNDPPHPSRDYGKPTPLYNDPLHPSRDYPKPTLL